MKCSSNIKRSSFLEHCSSLSHLEAVLNKTRKLKVPKETETVFSVLDGEGEMQKIEISDEILKQDDNVLIKNYLIVI